MVRTRTRLSQIPVTRETAAVGTVSRSDTWETQGTARNERWVKDGCQCRHVLESLCKVLSAVEAQTCPMLRTHQTRRCLARALFRFWITPRPAPIGSRVARSASLIRSAGPSFYRAPFQPRPLRLGGQRGFLHCSSLLQHSSAPAVSQALSICRHVGPTWWSKAWLNIAICGGCWPCHTLYNGRCHVFPDLLLSTWPETCSSSSSSLLVCCLVFLRAYGRSGGNSRYGCAKMVAK